MGTAQYRWWAPKPYGDWLRPDGERVDQPEYDIAGRVKLGYVRMATWAEGVAGWQVPR